jgi:Ca-activated chloride channel family protein
LQQWLRRVPDDPGGLLRRKFEQQYEDRLRKGIISRNDPDVDW